jgi:hypothetical protein
MSGVSEGIQTAVISALGVTIPPLIVLIVNSVRYTMARRNRVRQQRFLNYHKLVSWLVEGREDQEVIRLDSQIAVAYELRNYREYKEVSIRILEGLRERWAKRSDILDIDGLIKEIGYTLKDLKKE